MESFSSNNRKSQVNSNKSAGQIPSLGSRQFDINRIIVSIYQAATIADNSWEAKETLLHDVDQLLKEKDHSLISRLYNHLLRARRLVGETSQLQKERKNLSLITEKVSPPAIVFRPDKTLLKRSGSVSHLFKILGIQLSSSMQLVPSEMFALDKFIDSTLRYGFACEELANGQYWACGYFDGGNEPLVTLFLLDESADIQQTLIDLAKEYRLTDKELNVVRLVISEQNLEQLAGQLGVTLSTARQHLKNINKKLGIHSQTELVAFILNRSLYLQHLETMDQSRYPTVFGASQTQFLKLPNNRVLSYSDLGDPLGSPVLHFHALNGSRHELLEFSEFCRHRGVRLITPDRGGYGYSTECDDQNYESHPNDIKELLNHLHLDQVTAIANSAGCAHALAAAATLGNRFYHLHCFSAIPPVEYIRNAPSKTSLNSTLVKISRMIPGITQPLMDLVFMGQSVSSALTKASLSKKSNLFYLCEDDIEFLTCSQRMPYSANSMVESLRQGTKTWAKESTLLNKPWLFDYQSLGVPITFWHGSDDLLVPHSLISKLAGEIPNADTNFIAGETHLLIYRVIDKLVDRIK